MLYLEIFDYEFITVLANRVGFIYISEESIDLQNAYDWQQNQMLNLSRFYYLVNVIKPLAPEVQRERCNGLLRNLAECFVKFYNFTRSAMSKSLFMLSFDTENLNHLKVV